MYVELIAIPAITMPGSGVIIVGRNTACSAITCCRLMYCDTLSPHNVLVTQQTLAQNKTSRTREVRESRAYFKISPAKVPAIYRRILRTILLTGEEFVGGNPRVVVRAFQYFHRILLTTGKPFPTPRNESNGAKPTSKRSRDPRETKLRPATIR